MKKFLTSIALVSVVFSSLICFETKSVFANGYQSFKLLDENIIQEFFFYDRPYEWAYYKDNNLFDLYPVYVETNLAFSLLENPSEIPTIEDFSDLEGIDNVELNSYDIIDGSREFWLALNFKDYDSLINAYYKVNSPDYNNPILANAEKPYKGNLFGLMPYMLCSAPDIPSPVMGDVNCDRAVDTADFVCYAKYFGGDIDEFGSNVGNYQADIDQDGAIDIVDYTLLKNKLLKAK